MNAAVLLLGAAAALALVVGAAAGFLVAVVLGWLDGLVDVDEPDAHEALGYVLRAQPPGALVTMCVPYDDEVDE